jgi:hypothetical protein
MPITLNNSNISVQYNTGSNYIIETVKNDLYVRDTIGTTSNLFAEPTVSPTLTSNLAVFTHSGGAENQTPHTIYFPVNTTCDIAIVGGGGGGGGSMGGGGGGGSVIYSTNITIPAGTYSIIVGKGGTGGVNQTDATNGFDTIAFGATAVGGGRGGDYNISNSEASGGSGGGEGGGDTYSNQTGLGVAGLKGTNTIPNTSLLFTNYQYYVNNGGLAYYQVPGNNLSSRGGGGGGAGTAGGAGGGNGIDTTTQGVGGDGIPITITGSSVYYGAGGGGGAHRGTNNQALGKSGGLGGGGNGGSELSNGTIMTSGTNGTGYGSGGGGGSYSQNGGNGGSGIVIIKVISPTTNKYLFFNYLSTQTNYTLTFPVRTLVDVNNNNNLILQGQYNVSLGTTNSSIIPSVFNTSNRLIPLPNTSTSNISVRYHLLNPIKTAEGAQWTYSSNNPNVYHLGSVGIGTTNPEYSLDVRGFVHTSVGGYTGSTLTTWSITSDRRIKENIVKASYEKCLENVNKIELYNFNFKDNCVNTNDKHQLGFIAQEVREVYPKAVEVNKMILNTNETIDDILTLNTTQIDYTLYGAVKILIEKIDNIDIGLENLGSNITYNKDLIKNTSNIFSIITSNISITTSNIFIGTSNISITTSNISIKTSNIFIGTSNIPIETSNIPIETSNIPIETSNIPIESSNIPITSSNVSIESSNISIESSNISISTSNISIN